LSKAAVAIISVAVQGDGQNDSSVDTLQNSAAVAPTSVTTSNIGATVTLPAGTLRVKIVPLPTNTITLTLKGVMGDTGLPLNPAEPSYLSFAAGVSSFVIGSNGITTLTLYWC
jgi:hypothetical protein